MTLCFNWNCIWYFKLFLIFHNFTYCMYLGEFLPLKYKLSKQIQNDLVTCLCSFKFVDTLLIIFTTFKNHDVIKQDIIVWKKKNPLPDRTFRVYQICLDLWSRPYSVFLSLLQWYSPFLWFSLRELRINILKL